MFLLIIAVAMLLILSVKLRLEVNKHQICIKLLNDQMLILFITMEYFREKLNIDSEEVDTYIKLYKENLNVEIK